MGDELVPADKKDWNTQSGGVRVQALWRELTLTTGFVITASGNSIQSPWGNSPNFVLQMDRDFNRANEKAVLFGVAYDFSKLVSQGLTANSSLAVGWDAIDPRTRASGRTCGSTTSPSTTVHPGPCPPSPGAGGYARAAACSTNREPANSAGRSE